ncbi:MAG TPA: hypothetical protein VFE09_04940 [Rubrobacteraceae bacterium]|nr:hypothetical protein [Rubrobacteraceae bacterium]
MPEKNRPPEDEQPLARPVHEQQLARPVGGEQQEASRAEEEQKARQAEEEQEEKGLVGKAMDKVDEVTDKLADRIRHFEASVEIERPVENVFDYVTDLSFRSTGGPVPQEFTYTFEPTLEGTHLTQSVEAEPGTFFRLTGPLFEAAGRRQINNDLETLKDLLEAQG